MQNLFLYQLLKFSKDTSCVATLFNRGLLAVGEAGEKKPGSNGWGSLSLSID